MVHHPRNAKPQWQSYGQLFHDHEIQLHPVKEHKILQTKDRKQVAGENKCSEITVHTLRILDELDRYSYPLHQT
jgi:hypothetical protein